MVQNCLIIGGTGAQGAAVVRALVATPGRYKIKIMTRSAASSHAQALHSPDVSFIEGSCFDEEDLVKAFVGIDCCFVNVNGFAIGERNEIYWSIRIYEIAYRAGVKHFVYGGLDYCSQKAGFDPQYRCFHYDAKGKVGAFLKSQPTEPMNWTIIASGPYIESLSDQYRPQVDSTGTYVFSIPLKDGAMPLIHLDDLALYTRWAFENPNESRGVDLEIATAHASGRDIANAFTAVTGKPASYEDIDLETFMQKFWSKLPGGQDTKIGAEYAGKDDNTLMTYGQNFSAWWRIYQASGQNKGIIQRDYQLLDKILPGRVRSVEEWMRKTQYNGDRKPLLKDWADKGL